MRELLFGPITALSNMVALGGFVVVLIFGACLIMWAIVIERWWYFTSVLPCQSARLLADWQARSEHLSWTAHQVRKSMISRLNAGMSANLQLLRVLVPLCPLLGLLGTVTGMLNVFDVMAARGSADARSMANGVSEAMVCTLSGLAVSITGLYPNFYFRRRITRETERLSDKFVY
ncbi:MAG: MotA/TolQ/ExbB proton channel family protein [Nevskia sp.]|nr:MotA/TolQ/ExbB proton channel family protein [Nevskia sp.]